MNEELKKTLGMIVFVLMGLLIGVGGFAVRGAQGESLTLLKPEQCGTVPRGIKLAWPRTDFTQCTASIEEVRSGGPGKDGIPSIDHPEFEPAHATTIPDNEPVITVKIGATERVYPLRILIWHEIVNDVIEAKPVAVTYCPLCSAAIVFDRELGGEVLSFGTTGNLRKSDLVMYDRTTESWFQQYTGVGLFGALAGERLQVLPARLESVGEVKQRAPHAEMLVTPHGFLRAYGANPYVGYDTSLFPFLFDGEIPDGVEPLEYVIIAENRAWALSLLQDKGVIIEDGLKISWKPGQASALDVRDIAKGRDIGIVTVHDANTGELVPYKVSFAFVWHAFNPQGEIRG